MVAQLRTGWLTRVSFALVLLVFSEWGVWEAPGEYGVLRWLAVLGIYLALGAAVLDILARFRVNDVLRLFLVAGMYGLVNGTLISHVATRDIPLSLVGRPLGAHTLAFLLALGVFRLLANGRATGPFDMGIALVAGLAWGVWVRWLPSVADEPIPAVSAEDAIFTLALGLIAIGVLRFALRSDEPDHAEAWLLTMPEQLVVGGVLLGALVGGILQKDITAPGWGIVVSLLVYIMMLLVVTQHLHEGDSYLRTITPPQLPNMVGWVMVVVPALLMGWLGYNLPGSGDSPAQSDVLFGALLGFGLVWLPGVSAVLGVRAFVRLTRQGW